MLHALRSGSHRPRRAAVLVIAGLAAFVASAVAAAPAIAPSTDLVSVNATGSGGGNGDSFFATISADGRFISFVTEAGDLVANDGNGTGDVFVRDLKKGTTTLVSVNAAGNGVGNGVSTDAVISAAGRFIAFVSDASDLVSNDGNAGFDVFARDLKKRTTTLLSVNLAGTAGGNSQAGSPIISSDGRFVAFMSDAGDLVPSDGNGKQDVFVRDLKKGTTTLVSVNAAGSGNDSSDLSSISADGRFVTFTSSASDLVANDGNGKQDVFVRDLKKRTTTLVSVNAAGIGSGNGVSFFNVISAGGRFVAFTSGASDLVANDANGKQDVFVRDLKKRTTTLVSVNLAGTAAANGDSNSPQVSADGRFVEFQSNASDVVAAGGNAMRQIFVRDLRNGTTTLVSVNAAGTGGGNNVSFFAHITPNGRFVVFPSRASDLVATTGPIADSDVFVRDLKKGTTTLVSVNLAGTGTANGYSGNPVITADGRLVAFEATAEDLVTNDGNGKSDVFVRRIR